MQSDAERCRAVRCVCIHMCAPGPSDVARESRGSAPVLAERPLRGIDGRSMGEPRSDPLGDEGRRAGVEGRKLGERCGVIRPATMGATGCGPVLIHGHGAETASTRMYLGLQPQAPMGCSPCIQGCSPKCSGAGLAMRSAVPCSQSRGRAPREGSSRSGWARAARLWGRRRWRWRAAMRPWPWPCRRAPHPPRAPRTCSRSEVEAAAYEVEAAAM